MNANFNQSPKYITRADLDERLNEEIATLKQSDLVWWEAHKVTPFPAIHRTLTHYVVAVSGLVILFFADDEDEFGFGKLEQNTNTINDYGLAGDLVDAIRCLQRRPD